MSNLAIIGAGASGLAAAIEAKRAFPGAQITVFEKAPRMGRKILASGNGRCNLGNADLRLRFYHGADPGFAGYALERFGLDSTAAFFRSLCVPLRAEGARLYPYSLTASAVLDALRHEAGHIGVEILAESPVERLTRTKNGFMLKTPRGDFPAEAAIIACGGAASPGLGGCKDGYALLAGMGHAISPLCGSIVQLETDTEYVKALDGIRVDGAASLANGEKTACERGEILFVKYGLSGPAILQLSGRCARMLARGGQPVISVNLLPDLAPGELEAELSLRRNARGWIALEDYLVGLVHKRIGMMALKACGLLPLSRKADTLDTRGLARLAQLLQDWRFCVLGTRGLESAQVTAGGALTAQFDPRTMQSRLAAGLFACGEVLDIDGDCGATISNGPGRPEGLRAYPPRRRCQVKKGPDTAAGKPRALLRFQGNLHVTNASESIK